ncbi:MAG: N-acetylglucosamine-6-phosphate deacetylase [bacterium ADurb.Bin429]|nr:MAG: N-acetylglucosamine-6-phosphate deacetylase [bacterium ADurb.Bin429]
MRKCPACGAPYNVLDALCPQCGRELPAPYEGYDGAPAQPEGEALNADAVLAAIVSDEMPENTVILSGAEVMLGDTTYPRGSVVIADGKITEVLNFPITDPDTSATFVDLSGLLLAAGFVNLCPTLTTGPVSADALTQAAVNATAGGVTTLLPRLAPRAAEELAAVLDAFRAALSTPIPGARLAGLRVETPFRAPALGGLSLNDPDSQAMLALLFEHKDIIRMVTLAPELPGAYDLIHRLRDAGILVSLGGSEADYDDTLEALEAGASHVTRLFEQMPPLAPLAPGLVGAALERDEFYVEFTCETTVLHPAVISTIISAKGAERALPAAPDGEPLTAVRVLVEEVGWDLGEALSMFAATPALCLDGANFGAIQVAAVADLVILDQELQPVATLIGGGTVWQRE